MHGDDRLNITSESSVPKNTTTLVSWRVEQEQRIIAASQAGDINGLVIRPSLLYGRSGSITATLFAEAMRAAEKGDEIKWAGTPGGRWALVHADDLADLFVKAAECVSICSDPWRCLISCLIVGSYSQGYRY